MDFLSADLDGVNGVWRMGLPDWGYDMTGLNFHVLRSRQQFSFVYGEKGGIMKRRGRRWKKRLVLYICEWDVPAMCTS